MCVACNKTIARVSSETGVSPTVVTRIYNEASDVSQFNGDDTPGLTVLRISETLNLPRHMVGFVYLAILEDVRRTTAVEEREAARELLVRLGVPVPGGAEVSVTSIDIPPHAFGPEMN